MKFLKKSVAVILCISMTMSLCFAGAGATDSKPVSGNEALKNLERDIPVVYIIGLEGEFYKGLSTENEDDDSRIWGFPAMLKKRVKPLKKIHI